MTYIRGDKAEFDAWEQLGNSGWNWDAMLTYYKKVEKLFTPEPWQVEVGASFDGQYHGRNGELHVSFNQKLQNDSFYSTIKKTWASLGHSVNKDVNSGTTENFDVWPQTIDPTKNTRWDAATAFLWPVAENRKNLRLINGTASRVLWKNDGQSSVTGVEASGIQYTAPDGKTRTIKASKEVILSAGALRSPLILERSGIGNPQFLKSKGIKVVVESPGVGENMIDQPNSSIFYSSNDTIDGFTPYAMFANVDDIFGSKVQQLEQETKTSISRWAKDLVAANAPGGLNASALEHIFNIQHDLIFKKRVTVAEILTAGSGNNVGTAYWELLPFCRGSVHIRSAEDVGNPVIDPKYLFVDFDLATQIAAGRLTTKFWSSRPARDIVGSQILPASPVLTPESSDAEWQKFLADNLGSNSHAVGTAAMMSKELGGVVDSKLKVYGTKNLRVVDASILPMQFSGHLTATLYAVADRASEFILKSNGA